jgi:protein gp37
MSTHIQWTDETLNVVTGCTRISEGCTHCYIERTPPFRMQGRRFLSPDLKLRIDGKGTGEIGATTGVRLHPERLTVPLRWRKPRRIFVCSLADLFHDDVPDGLIAALWLVMGQCAGCIPEQYRGHTFQILTKRPVRMRAFLRRWADTGDPKIAPMDPAATQCGRAELVTQAAEYLGGVMTYDWIDGPRYWPTALPNVWLGVSVENQQWADIRIPALLETPAAVRWISAEPLLGPVDLTAWLTWSDGSLRYSEMDAAVPIAGLDWCVVGGESGPDARPMHPGWVRSLRDQCTQAEVAFFFKQWGEWREGSHDPATEHGPDHVIVWDGRHEPASSDHFDAQTRLGRARLRHDPGTEHATVVSRVGKGRAGRLLDGWIWDQFPRSAR